MVKRKIKLKDGTTHNFYGEQNPCGCGSNVFHLEDDGTDIYGVCNACKRDIYVYKEREEFEEWKFKN